MAATTRVCSSTLTARPCILPGSSWLTVHPTRRGIHATVGAHSQEDLLPALNTGMRSGWHCRCQASGGQRDTSTSTGTSTSSRTESSSSSATNTSTSSNAPASTSPSSMNTGDSDLAYVLKLLALSTAGAAVVKYGSLLTTVPFNPNPALALSVVLGIPTVVAVALYAKSQGAK